MFHEATAPSQAQLQILLDNIIKRILRLLARQGHLIEEEGVTYLACTESIDPDNVLALLQASSYFFMHNKQ